MCVCVCVWLCVSSIWMKTWKEKVDNDTQNEWRQPVSRCSVCLKWKSVSSVYFCWLGEMNRQGTEVLHACRMFLSPPFHVYQDTRCDKTVYCAITQPEHPYRIYVRTSNERCNNPQVATVEHEAISTLMIHKIHSWFDALRWHHDLIYFRHCKNKDCWERVSYFHFQFTMTLYGHMLLCN